MIQPTVIGVAGGSGSGKTTLVREIVRVLGAEQVSVVQHDCYYCDRSTIPPEDRDGINYDHPDALETSLLVRHLGELKRGRPVQVPVYDFATHVRTQETVKVEPRKVVIVEGILILADPELRELMDIRVFVRTDGDLRVIRRIERDLVERDRSLDSVVRQYLATVRPMHLEFVEPSERWADVVISEGGYDQPGMDMLMARIRSVSCEQ